MLKGILGLLLFVFFAAPAFSQIVDDRYPPVAGKHATEKHRGARSAPKAEFALAGKPAGCPARAWCGCFLSKYFGLHRRDLWLAKNWAHVGRASPPQAGAIAVWRHHVGKVIAIEPGRIKLLSGNDGRAVRERWRSARGVIAYRVL